MCYQRNLDYVFSECCDEHMITVKHICNTKFDENHCYYNKSFKYLFYMIY